MEIRQITNIIRANVRAAGFALPSVLIIVSALLILAVGILLIAGIDRSAARAFSDRQRAELAAQAGLENVRSLLNMKTANDDYLIIQSTLANPLTPGAEAAPHLFLTRAVPSASASYRYSYWPLFSTHSLPNSGSTLTPPDLSALLGATGDTTHKDFKALPYQDKVCVAWLPVKDEKNRIIARYAFWVEDLQSRIDPTIAGNENGTGGTHARAAWPFPAAGLSPSFAAKDERALDQVAIFSVKPDATDDDQGDIGKNLIKNRHILTSPESLLAAAGLKPPLSRLASEDIPSGGKIGDLIDVEARSVERSLSSGIRSYKEQPLIPFSDGIVSSVAGNPKLNLNKLLAIGGSAAVDEMAGFIATALPTFGTREGGFPDNYLKTLAANAIDYADANAFSTMGSDYRGVDAYPLISEFLMRFGWSEIEIKDGKKYVIIEVTTYAELWNMTDQTIFGSAEFTHDTKYQFPMEVGGDPISLGEMSNTVPSQLTSSDGSYWFPKRDVTLKPNEYLLLNCGTVKYRIGVVTKSGHVSSPLNLDGEAFGASQAGYRLKWNGQIIDQARGYINRSKCTLRYKSSKKVRATVPSLSHKTGITSMDYKTNMGDPRMSFYNTAPQDANAYPDHYSPNRRNIRYTSIYQPNTSSVYGRVMPSEWPDGGHNSSCAPAAAMEQTDDSMDPEAPVFQADSKSLLRNPEAEEAPFRLSPHLTPELQRFYSATELGRVYDPIMWTPTPPSTANLPWGDVETFSIASSHFGGGNTLRIGRPEHPKFDQPLEPGKEAYRLLDLFHAGISRSSLASDREGPLVEIDGHVNINTASRDALRAIIYGRSTMDNKIAKRPVETHDMTAMRPRTIAYRMPAAEVNAEANRIVDAIIAARKIKPYTSPSEISEVREVLDPKDQRVPQLVFGNKNLITDGMKIHRTDSAAEELFARLYEASTVRSRNFRVWVIGQAVSPTVSNEITPEVLSEARKAYTVFADPGERESDGSINPSKFNLKIIHESDF